MKKILIVDDDDALCELLATTFRSRGFEVFTAGNTTDGIQLAATHAFDAVLTDFLLPSTDGLTLCRAIKYQNHTLGYPLLVWLMTASQELSDSAAIDAGAQSVFRKPFRPVAVCEHIATALQTRAEQFRPSEGEPRHRTFSGSLKLKR